VRSTACTSICLMTTLNPPDLGALPALPRDEQGPLFAEPWQAQAFALAVRLRAQGYFTWTEWCTAMNRQILLAQQAGDPDLGDTYYTHWLAALETLVVEKGLSSVEELSTRKDAWDRAHRATAHGEPVSLEAAARGQRTDSDH
jgi:nitrile hydratase accessory protein